MNTTFCRSSVLATLGAQSASSANRVKIALSALLLPLALASLLLQPARATTTLADQPVFYDDLTVWEHLEYIARLHGTDDWEQQAVDLVDMVGLMDRVDDLPTTFSRGLKQKAALTMAFVRPFDVMLIDEPFVGLDRLGKEALLELLTLAHGDGATLVVATHELSSVKESSRLIALSSGVVTYDGDPAEADLTALTEGVRQDHD